MPASAATPSPTMATPSKDRPFRVLILATHVIPYGSYAYRLLAQDPRLQIEVAYCSLQGSTAGADPEFGIEIRWDTPLLEGYPWVEIPNRSPRPGLGRFFGLLNTPLWHKIRSGNYDAVVIYTGYMYASFWIASLAAKTRGVPVLISSDSSSLHQREGKRWRALIKPWIVGKVYRFADVLMAASDPVKDLAVQLGKPQNEITIIRSGVNKDAWLPRLAQADRDAIRSAWNIPAGATVVFYCAKLQPWKRPLDLLRAFATTHVPGAYLVFAGDGPQREELEREAASLRLLDRVRILGFLNDSQLPGAYKASDLFVLPSEYDPCPLVVPEAMFSGLPVLLSDAVIGRLELIEPGNTGFSYPCGNVAALGELLQKILADPALLQRMKTGVSRRMERWTSSDFLDSWVGAVQLGKRLKQYHGRPPASDPST